MKKYFIPENITVPFPSTKRPSIERPNGVIDLYQYILDVTNSGVTYENGITKSSGVVKLGGNIIEDTVLSADPTSVVFGFGDLGSEKIFGVGNTNADGKFMFSVFGADGINIITSNSVNSDYARLNLSANDTSNFAYNGLAIISATEDYGFFNFDNGGQKTANIYYGIVDGMGNVTDISRIEANKYKVHARRIIDPTGVLPNYNGMESSDTYCQLEFNKTAEDGQATGYCLTVDSSGLTFFVNGTNYFRVEPDGDTILNGRFQQKKGANIASTSNITFGDDGNIFIITGTTTVQTISSVNWQAGSVITLIFQSTAGVKHGAGNSGNNKQILLNGSTDLPGAANNTLQLVYDGTQWQELSRKTP